MRFMAKKDKKEEKKTEEKVEKKKEKKIVKKPIPKKKPQSTKLYSQRELADMLGMTIYQLDSLYSIRGINRKTKMSLEEAHKLFKM